MALSRFRWCRALIPAFIILFLCAGFLVLGPTPEAAAITSIPYEWSASHIPGSTSLFDVAPITTKDIWAAGNNGATGAIFHFNGSAWSLAHTDAARIRGIYALDASHIWFVGDLGKILFYDGHAWHDQSVGGSSNLNSISGLDASHVWAAGMNGRVLFYNGSSWHAMASHTAAVLNCVYAYDQTHVWAVGSGGKIIFFNGASWANQSLAGSTDDLYGIVAVDSGRAWACGANGSVLLLRGAAPWIAAPAGYPDALRGIFALDSSHVLIAADNGYILCGNEDYWYRVSTGNTSSYWGIKGLDPRHIYAVAGDGNMAVGGTTGEIPDRFWYFAEGTTRPGFDPYFCIQNPNAHASQVEIMYMLGVYNTGMRQEVTVPPMSRTTVVVKDFLGVGDDPMHDFSAQIHSLNGYPVLVERPVYFNYKSSWGEMITGGTDVIGARETGRTFYFAEGTCRPGFDPYICIMSPDADAQVHLTYMLGDGTTREQDVTVGFQSRTTIPVRDVLGSADDTAHDFSVKIQSVNDKYIFAERPIYFSYQGSNGAVTGGHDVVGAPTPGRSFYFAEGSCRPGFDPYLCIQNTSESDARVRISYMKGDGTTDSQDVTVGRLARATVNVRDRLGTGADTAHDFSALVRATNGAGIIVERPTYFTYSGAAGAGITGGHDVMGSMYPSNDFYFAEGTCRPAFDPYLCVQNPSAWTSSVTVTYMKGDGTSLHRTVAVAAHSRVTIPVKDVLGAGEDVAHDFSAYVSSTVPVVCERPMYFNYHGTIDGGHDVMGFVP